MASNQQQQEGLQPSQAATLLAGLQQLANELSVAVHGGPMPSNATSYRAASSKGNVATPTWVSTLIGCSLVRTARIRFALTMWT